MKLKFLPLNYKRKIMFSSTLDNIQIQRVRGVVIYELREKGRVIGWEIGKVRKKAYRAHKPIDPADGLEYTHYEKKWKDEDFGVIAWYYPLHEEDRLKNKWLQLTNEE